MTDVAVLEALIRAGEFAKVARAVAKLNVKKVPRAEAARFANVANRTDQSRLAMRLLFPIIHSEQREIAPANDQEKIEYADALRRAGLLNEALEILREVDFQKYPSAHLTISFCYFNEWRYDQALPHLRQLIQATNPDDYAQTIAKVNLAAALVNEQSYEDALPLLEDIQERTSAKGQKLLLGNSLEIMAQVFIRQGRWIRAEQTLERAQKTFGQDSNKYLFFVRKWQAIIHSLKAGVVQDELLKIRDEAQSRRDWESVRECDLHIGVIARDSHLLQKVYFGTPHASYRKRLLQMASFPLPDEFLWSASLKPKHTFDLVKAACHDGSAAMAEGSLPHQMMMHLCADFYRPISIGSAFNTLFRGEKFGQQGSANRVSQIIMRLRRIFDSEKPGFSITETRGQYRLELAEDCAVRVAAETPAVSRNDLSWMKYKDQLPGSFSRRDLERVSSCSAAKAKRLLRWALANGQIRSTGWGPNTKYQIAAKDGSVRDNGSSVSFQRSPHLPYSEDESPVGRLVLRGKS